MMVSVAMAGYAGPELAGSASGLGGLCGYAGATLAGVGLGAVAEYFGWGAVFAVLTASSLAAALCFALTIRAPQPAGGADMVDLDRHYEQHKSSRA
jgi:OPA family glycerol-3-phosphate transporter-like MFS transporter